MMRKMRILDRRDGKEAYKIWKQAKKHDKKFWGSEKFELVFGSDFKIIAM